MSTAVLLVHQHRATRPMIAELFRRHPLFAGAALCLLILMAPTLFAMAMDQRTLLGINVWVKPLKFEVALAVYLATLAWFAGWLPRTVADAQWHRLFSRIVVLAITLEMIWIIGAAAFGVASHFNDSSAVMIGLYALMGMLAVVLTSAALVYGITILLDRNSTLDPALRLSISIGLIATFVLTVALAGYMSDNGGHFVSGNQSDAEGLALMGWARDGGDLRVAHFFATHAMHFIPAFGLVASRLLYADAASRAVIAFAGLFVAFVGYVFLEARSGQPFLAMLY